MTTCIVALCSVLFLPHVAHTAAWSTVFEVPGAIFTSATEMSNALFISAQDGRIWRNGSMWLDMRDMVDASGEGGLNSMASDGVSLYAFMVTRDRHMRVYRVSESERAMIFDAGVAGLRHNAGGMVWHDGALYIGIGDQAPDDNRETLAALRDDSFIGKVIRFQPDIRTVEIYASGFRNPWAMRWMNGNPQRVASALYVADVGEQRTEELNRVEPGLSYGWPCYEGAAAYIYAPHVCATTINTLPAFAYGRERGRAIVGIGQGVVVDYDGAIMDYASGAIVNRVPNAPVSAAFWSSRGLYAMSFEDGIGRVHVFR